MNKTYFDDVLGRNVTKCSNINHASEILARQLHNEAVANNEAIDTDWDDRGYRYGLFNEAMAILKEKGCGPTPSDGDLPIIVLSTNIEE